MRFGKIHIISGKDFIAEGIRQFVLKYQNILLKTIHDPISFSYRREKIP